VKFLFYAGVQISIDREKTTPISFEECYYWNRFRHITE